MRDLPDDLAAMLHDRADLAPAVPAPPEALLRRVRRRRATRLSLAVAGSAAGVGAVAVVAAATLSPTPRAVQPAATPAVTESPYDDRYEFCDLTAPAPSLSVSVHRSELKFADGCYVLASGTRSVTFANPHTLPHDLVVLREGTRDKVLDTDLVQPNGAPFTSLGMPFERGDYALTCSIHPAMHAQLVVR